MKRRGFHFLINILTLEEIHFILTPKLQFCLDITMANYFDFIDRSYSSMKEYYQNQPYHQFNIGMQYALGHGKPQDYVKAYQHLKIAADKGYAPAQRYLGIMYLRGDGVPQDYAKAFEHFKSAARKRYAPARYNLGVMYENGLGVPQNYSEAFRNYKLAADRGLVDAQKKVGDMYKNNMGVARNAPKAAYYYKLAADQGNMGAMEALGKLYFSGEGIQKNYTEAKKFFEMAIKNGSAEAEPYLKELRQQLKLNRSQKDLSIHDKSLRRSNKPNSNKLDSLRRELTTLVGLEHVKADIDQLVKLISVLRLRKAAGLKIKSMSLHCVYLGSPGTGKTTVARLYGAMLKELGFLSKGHLVETDRTGLVAGYVGQTELKTDAIINSALGGVLFIDEAYSLYKGNDTDRDYGPEAISVLLKRMEDHRDDFVVIVAGYEKPMAAFLQSNEGIRSRFPNKISFPDYSPSELVSIFKLFCKQNDYKIQSQALDLIKYITENQYRKRDDSFGNARLMRNLFESVVKTQSVRIAETLNNPTPDDLMTIVVDDVRPLIADAS